MNGYLLDTHTFLWMVWKDNKLSKAVQQILLNPQSSLFLSVASVFEIAVKVSIKKLILAEPVSLFIHRWIASFGIQLLAIQVSHCDHLSRMPLAHRDPIDRILASQALLENLTLLSIDPIFDQYGVARAW